VRTEGRRSRVWLAGLLCAASCLTPPPATSNDPSAAATADADTAAAILWEGRKPGDLYGRMEVRAFEFTQGGRSIGSSWGRYAGPVASEPGRHRFETRIEIVVPGRGPIRSSGEIVLDDQGHLVRGFERSEAAELRYRRRGEVIELTDGTAIDELGYAPARGDAVMAHSAILHEELMFALRDLPEGQVQWRLISVSGGPPIEWEATVSSASAGDPEVLVIETSLGETVRMHRGRIETIDVPDSGLSIVALDDATWPDWDVEGPRRLVYEPPPGATFERREVELPGRPGEPALFGEVLIPTVGTPPLGAALFVSGTGQEDRFGFAGPPPVDLGGHQISDALANAGLVVLRFDERGRGRSESGPLSFDGQVEDARRAFRTLMVQPEVDPDRVVVVGHGESGIRVLHIAAAHPGDVVGVALLAVPGRPYREVFLHQAAAALDQLPPDLRAEAQAEQEAMLEALEGGKAVPPELEPQAQWIREMLQTNVEQLIGRTTAPLWLAQGGKDFEVDPDADLGALVRAAKKHGKKIEVRRYPDLDHLFKRELGVSTPQRYLDPSRRVDLDFLDDLAAWAVAATSPGTRESRRGPGVPKKAGR
jgi:pimeloyl-ACP methyl ester carboxylesterase